MNIQKSELKYNIIIKEKHGGVTMLGESFSTLLYRRQDFQTWHMQRNINIK